MDVSEFRSREGISQLELAIQLGLRSKGRISRLETGAAIWPTDLAIQMDRLSKGKVPVAQLRPDLHDVRVLHDAEGAAA